MRKLIIIVAVLFILYPYLSLAADFLGAPMVSPGKVVSKTKTRLEMTTSLSHDETVAFYKQRLKNNRDIKFRDWKEVTYIEDTGNLVWHSITISKEGTPTTITIRPMVFNTCMKGPPEYALGDNDTFLKTVPIPAIGSPLIISISSS